MKSRAAVAFAPNTPLQIVEIDVEPPRKGEVLIKITHTGVCHTDAYTLSGDDPEGLFPAVLGHEGAGIVVEVGEGVTSVRPGERVTVNPARSCRECEDCRGGRPNLCRRTIMLGSASTRPPTDGAMARDPTDNAPAMPMTSPATHTRSSAVPATARIHVPSCTRRVARTERVERVSTAERSHASNLW